MTDPVTSPDPDAALVAQAQRRDVAAFEQLYRRHAGRVHALCLRLTGSAPSAEDLTQQAFVRAWERLDGFRGEAAFGSWLHRLAVNVVLADRRAQERRLAHLDPARDPETEPALPRPAGARLDLEAAVAVLPPKARVVFVLHDVHGWSHPEIAESMGITAGTSKGQLHRARGLLREALS